MLKYEFHVRPGASPSDIKLAYGGADGLAVNDAGQLQISTPLGVLQDSAPVSYQDIDGVRMPVRAATCSAAARTRRFSFAVGGYQRDHELIIDPGVQYTTFLGGNAPRPASASRSTRPATSSWPAPRSRPTSRPRPARSIAPARRRTSPTCSSRSSTPPARRSSTRPSSAAATWSSATAWRSTRPATRTSRARRSRRTSRPPAARSTGSLNSRPTARGAPPTTPTASSSS